MASFTLEEAEAALARPITLDEANAELPAESPPGSPVDDLAYRAFGKPAGDLVTGYKAGASDLYRTGANALALINKGADYLTEKTGIGLPSTSPESGFGAAEKWMRDTAQKVAPAPEELPTDMMGKIYSGLGRAPVDLAQYGGAAKAVGPVAAFAGVDAVRESDKGPEAAALAGAKGALLGGVFKVAEPLTTPAKIGTLAGVGAGQAAVEGGDVSDAVAGGTVLGLLGGMGRGGDTRLRDIPGNARQAVEEVRQRLSGSKEEPLPERIEPTLKPAETAKPETVPVSEARPAVQDENTPPVLRDETKPSNAQSFNDARAEPVTEPAKAAEPGISRSISLEDANRSLTDLPEVSEMAPPGSKHIGMRQQAFDPAVEPTGKPIRREDVLGPLFKAFDAPLYEGRVKGKSTLGFFRRANEEVRIKHANDLETAIHEAGHLLDSRVPEIKAQYSGKNAPFRDELLNVSYDVTKPHEGFAEYLRLWATQPTEAAGRAPRFNAWFNDFVARNEYGPALTKFRQDAGTWFEQAALDRARSKIGEAEPVNAFLNAPLSKFRQSVFDDLHGIMRMEHDLTGKLSPVGAYETARLTRGKSALMEGTLQLGAPRVNPDGSHSFVGKGLAQILKPVTKSLDDFLLYSVGRSARELSGQGREHLFTPAEIKAMVRLEKPKFRTAFDEYQVWNRSILDFAQAKGIINPHVRSQWMRADYLPFHRVDQGGQVQKVPGDWKGIKALTGGTENIRDVLTNVIGNARMLIDASLTNEARLKVADLAKGDGGAKFMAKIPTDSRIVKVQAEEVRQAILKALGMDARDMSTEARGIMKDMIDAISPIVELAVHNQAPVGRNIVAVLRHGKPEYYEVADPVLYRALTSLNRPTAHWAVQLLAVPKRIGQASVTLAADFIAANFVRDTLMGSIMSQNGFKPIIDSARGMKARLAKDVTYREFVANGGGLASHLLDEAAFRTHMSRFYASKGIDYKTILNTPAKLLYGLERIAESFEMATRLGEYRQAVARGEHPRHAAYSAREVSTDFGMRGDSQTLGFLYDTALFFKAGMNGMDRLYRGVVHDPNKGAIAAKSGLLALASMGLYGINRGNPLYDQLEDWDKDAHWHFFVPKPEALKARSENREVPLNERYLHLKYPKIWEIGAMSSLAERSVGALLDGMSQEDALKMVNTVRRAFSLDPTPFVFKPMVETAFNYDTFRGQPIESRAAEDLAPWARSSPGTPMVLRKAGEAMRDLPRSMQLSPDKMEHLLRGYLNTFALYGLSMADAGLYDSAPELRTDQLPVLRRFYAQEPARQTRYVRELYDTIKEASEARRTMAWMDKHWRPDLADELETKEANRLYGQATHVRDQLAIFRRETEQVLTAETIPQLRRLVVDRAKSTRNPAFVSQSQSQGGWNDPGALKRYLLDDLTRERNEFAEGAWRDMQKSRGELKQGASGVGR